MLAIYQVDAFSEKLFGGNPAAVVPFDQWPEDELLQSIANENNLAETAFIVQKDNRWEIRWFTPTAEISLCGHATLAAAHVAFHHLDHGSDTITFETREAGTLEVARLNDQRLSMSFPAIPVTQSKNIDGIASALNKKPMSVWKGYYSKNQFDYMAVLETELDIASLKPDESVFAQLGSRGVIATSVSTQWDFVSRYFAPAFGIPEDPVTGSAHCLLAPYWADVLSKKQLSARQLSTRGGFVECVVSTDQVELIGHAVDYMTGTITVAN